MKQNRLKFFVFNLVSNGEIIVTCIRENKISYYSNVTLSSLVRINYLFEDYPNRGYMQHDNSGNLQLSVTIETEYNSQPVYLQVM